MKKIIIMLILAGQTAFSANSGITDKKTLILRASVSVMYEFEYFGSNDVQLFYVAGEVKGYSANLAPLGPSLRSAANGGFVLDNQAKIRACADAYMILNLAASPEASGGDETQEDRKLIPSNARVERFTCNREALNDSAIYETF